MGRCSAISLQEVYATEKALRESSHPHRDACLFSLGVETGLRISELLSITFADALDTAGHIKRVLKINKEHCKGKHNNREIPLSLKAKDAIFCAAGEAYSRGQSKRDDYLFSPSFRRGSIGRIRAYDIISTALKRAGITHTSGTHTARKTYAALLLAKADKAYNAGEIKVFPMLAVQLGLGHAELATTQRYLESGIEEVNKLIEGGLS